MNMKQILLTAVMLGSSLAFSAANDTILTFSTKGPDTYGDGSMVLNGERYALVWVQNGTTFAGLAADGTPLADTTKVIAVAPLAKAGKCPETVFEIDAEFAETLKNGAFGLYLLDTRVSATELAKDVNGKPASVNAAGAASAAASDSFSSSTATSVSLATVGVYTKIDEPTISALEVKGAQIELKVAGMVENHDYFVVPGTSPSAFKPALATKPVGDTFTFDAPADATFFKVIGARKFK